MPFYFLLRVNNVKLCRVEPLHLCRSINTNSLAIPSTLLSFYGIVIIDVTSTYITPQDNLIFALNTQKYVKKLSRKKSHLPVYHFWCFLLIPQLPLCCHFPSIWRIFFSSGLMAMGFLLLEKCRYFTFIVKGYFCF